LLSVSDLHPVKKTDYFICVKELSYKHLLLVLGDFKSPRELLGLFHREVFCENKSGEKLLRDFEHMKDRLQETSKQIKKQLGEAFKQVWHDLSQELLRMIREDVII
jgi:hypothetical protein